MAEIRRKRKHRILFCRHHRSTGHRIRPKRQPSVLEDSSFICRLSRDQWRVAADRIHSHDCRSEIWRLAGITAWLVQRLRRPRARSPVGDRDQRHNRRPRNHLPPRPQPKAALRRNPAWRFLLRCRLERSLVSTRNLLRTFANFQPHSRNSGGIRCIDDLAVLDVLRPARWGRTECRTSEAEQERWHPVIGRAVSRGRVTG